MKAIITAWHWTDELKNQFGGQWSVVTVPDSTEQFLAQFYHHGRFSVSLRTERTAALFKRYGETCASCASNGKTVPAFSNTISEHEAALIENKDVAFVIEFENDYD